MDQNPRPAQPHESDRASPLSNELTSKSTQLRISQDVQNRWSENTAYPAECPVRDQWRRSLQDLQTQDHGF